MMLLSLLPCAALPEGAVKTLDCELVQVCDGGGRCEPASGRVSFKMAPVDLDAGGAARYTLSYEDSQADMQAMSDAGPFLWTLPKEQHALIASSETQWLWHRLTLDLAPAATIRFLACTFTQ